MAEQIGEDVAKEVMGVLFRKAKKEINYLLDYTKNVRNLRDEVRQLKEIKGRLEQRITSAKEQADVILEGVEPWVKDANAKAKEVDKFLQKEAEANTTWLHVYTRRHFSSQACTVMTPSVSKMLENGKRHDTGDISFKTPPPGMLRCYRRKNLAGLETHKKALEELKEAMKHETKQTIILYGLGGVGKSTLAKEVACEVKDMFDDVAFTVVSQTVKVDEIQKELEAARTKMEQGKKVLFILDDVWRTPDLEELRIPPLSTNKNCKILLTCRTTEVFTDEEAETRICINPLQEGEAWQFFKAVVGEAVETDINLKPIAEAVVSECGGLPLLIEAVGKALKPKSSDLKFWNACASQLSKSAPEGISPDVRKAFNTLQFSYNCLDAEAQSCFLLCCLFPEDSDIPMEKLVEYGVGLGNFKGIDSLEDAREKVRIAMTNLKSASLLLGADEEEAKMHDVFRDMGIFILNRQDKNGHSYLVEAGMRLRTWQPKNHNDLTNHAGISLMHNYITSLPKGLKCPKLHILLLQAIVYDPYPESKFPEDLFQDMPELQVLDLEARIKTIPQSIKKLTNLRTLTLSRNHEIESIHILGGLTNLEILKLDWCSVKHIPYSIGRLTNLRLFDVRGCDVSYIAPGVISRLCNLEELYIGYNSVQWEMNHENGKPSSKAIIEELRDLKRLKVLDLFMPNAYQIQENLRPENLLRFTIQIGGNHWDESFSANNAYSFSTLILAHDMRSPLLDWIVRSIKAANSLALISFQNLDGVFHELNNTAADALKLLELKSCDSKSCLVDEMDGAQWQAFNSLEALRLSSLDNLSEICHGELPEKAFSKLQRISIDSCNKMLNVMAFGSVQVLQNLKAIDASHCESLTCVFANKGLAVRNGEAKFLSTLQVLDLEDLPRLEAVWTCPDQFISLCNLVTLKIIRCDKLRNSLFPTAVAKGFVHLRELEIEYADGLEEVICSSDEQETVVEGEETKSTMKIVFPCLEVISLRCLYNLKSFSSGHHRIEYPSLYSASIRDNVSMEIWGYGIQVTPKLTSVHIGKYKHLKLEDRDGFRDLNDIVRTYFRSSDENSHVYDVPPILDSDAEGDDSGSDD